MNRVRADNLVGPEPDRQGYQLSRSNILGVSFGDDADENW